VRPQGLLDDRRQAGAKDDHVEAHVFVDASDTCRFRGRWRGACGHAVVSSSDVVTSIACLIERYTGQ
jgi:hypothetical protein